MTRVEGIDDDTVAAVIEGLKDGGLCGLRPDEPSEPTDWLGVVGRLNAELESRSQRIELEHRGTDVVVWAVHCPHAARDAVIVAQARHGVSYEQLASDYGISPSRVAQIARDNGVRRREQHHEVVDLKPPPLRVRLLRIASHGKGLQNYDDDTG
jgi:hypothetical protein